MRPSLHAALAFLAAFILAWICAIVVYVLGSGIGWWADRDGGVAMGFFFSVGPAVGTVAGVIAAIWAFRRARRTEPKVADGTENPKSSWPWPIRVLLAAFVFGGAAYLIGILIFWIFFPYRGSSYDPTGQAYWNAPAVMGLIAALIGGLKAARG